MKIYSNLCVASYSDLNIVIDWNKCFLYGLSEINKKMELARVFGGVFQDLTWRVKPLLEGKVVQSLNLIVSRVAKDLRDDFKSAEVVPNKVFRFNLILNCGSDEFEVQNLKLKDQFKCLVDGSNFQLKPSHLRGLDLNLRGKLTQKELEYINRFLCV